MVRRLLLTAAVVWLSACGGPPPPTRALGVRQALTSHPELLEFETPAARLELLREVVRASAAEAGQAASALVLFPMFEGDRLIAAPALDPRADLLSAPDAGVLLLALESRADRWPEDRREALQGLSEREAAELVARSLLSQWSLRPSAPIAVDRATGAPYAAAYVDGVLRLNPAFLYLVAAGNP